MCGGFIVLVEGVLHVRSLRHFDHEGHVMMVDDDNEKDDDGNADINDKDADGDDDDVDNNNSNNDNNTQ